MAFLLKQAKGQLDTVTGKKKIEEEKKKTASIESQLQDVKEDLAEMKNENAKLKEHIQHLEMEVANERAMRLDAQKDLQAKLESEEAEKSAGEGDAKAKADAELLLQAMEETAKKQALLDAQKAYEATSGLLTKEVKLAESICMQSYQQNQVLRQTYLSNYGKDLYKVVKSHTSGHLRTMLLGVLDGPTIFECQNLKDAMSGLTTNDILVVNTLAPSTNEHLKELKAKYQELYGKDLSERVSKCVGGDVGALLVALLQCTRSDSTTVDENLVMADANALYAAGEGKMIGKDPQPFISILTQRSPAHLASLNTAYQKVSPKARSLQLAIDRVFGGSMLQALSIMLAANLDAATYWCDVAENAMKGIGCDSFMLIDCLIRRREIDMDRIKRIYQTSGEHSRPFSERVQEELGGDVGKAGAMLLGEYKPE